MRLPILLAAAAVLSACREPVTRTSPVTSPAAAPSLSAADLGELSVDGMIARLIRDLDTISQQIAAPRGADELISDLRRVEEIGTDYRTIALRLEREIQAGDVASAEMLNARRADLLAAGQRLEARRDALIAAVPQMEADIRETFDKFDFGFLEGRSAVPSER